MTKRYETHIEDGTVYVEADIGRVKVGPYRDLINRFDEDNLRETVEVMTHSERAVEWMQEKSTEPEPDGFFDGGLRMALFAGFVSEAVENGPM